MKYNIEAEKFDNSQNCWLLAYAECSEFYIPKVLHIERNDDKKLIDDDELASIEAEKAGIPLIYGMEHVPDRVYVDTEENRKIINEMLILYPEYKKWGKGN